jgi:hypothetical protein
VPLPEEQRLKFFVYIVESPSAVDLYHGTHEGTMLLQSLQLNQIASVARLTATATAFRAAFQVGLPETMKTFPNLVPVIHISGHGSADGLELTDGTRISWNELKGYLQPINKALGHALFVCMSCCKGYSGTRMAMALKDEDFPFFALIGNYESPTWSDTSVAFCAFYHLLNKGETVINAVKAMNVASGLESFVAERAEDTRTSYRAYVSKQQLEEAQQELDELAARVASEESSPAAVGGHDSLTKYSD